MSARHLDRFPGIRPGHRLLPRPTPLRRRRRAHADALRDCAAARERLAAIGCYLIAALLPALPFAAAWLRGWRP